MSEEEAIIGLFVGWIVGIIMGFFMFSGWYSYFPDHSKVEYIKKGGEVTLESGHTFKMDTDSVKIGDYFGLQKLGKSE